MIAICPSIIPW